MAVCILAMLFIGVGMVSTVASEYLTLVNIHKPLGILILILALIRLVVRLRLRRPAPAARSAGTHEARGLSLALCALRAHDRDAADRLGDAVGRGLSGDVVAGHLAAADRAARPRACTRCLWNAHFYLAFLFFALILMHLAAGLFHALIRRDGVFDAMGPHLTHDEIAPAEWREPPSAYSIEVSDVMPVESGHPARIRTLEFPPARA